MPTLIHTSDWHLGQKLDCFDRCSEHEAFLNWLLNQMTTNPTDALVVTGDIFDSANPPVSAVRLFAEFTVAAHAVCPNIIYLAGNHDSAGRLESLAPFLDALGITLVSKFDSQIHPMPRILKTRSGQSFARLAAIPYIRPSELPPPEPQDSPDKSYARILEAIRSIYREAAGSDSHNSDFPHIPLICTGHLFLQGGQASGDSERPLLVEAGRLESIPVNVIPENCAYAALGHLHRMQKIPGHPAKTPVFYSGSPIRLSFSEAFHTKYVLRVNISEAGAIESVDPVEIPQTMGMIDISGSLDEISDEFRRLREEYPAGGNREALARISVRADVPSPDLRMEVLRLAESTRISILAIRRLMRDTNDSAGRTDEESPDLSEMSPQDVFVRKYKESCTEPMDGELMDAFDELYREALVKLQAEDSEPEVSL